MSKRGLGPGFTAANKRRHELIDKMFRGFSKEESGRRFDQHPGWEKEFDRRCKANLTPAEHRELKQLEKFVDERVNKAFPLPDLRELEALLERAKKLEKRAKARLKKMGEGS